MCLATRFALPEGCEASVSPERDGFLCGLMHILRVVGLSMTSYIRSMVVAEK